MNIHDHADEVMAEMARMMYLAITGAIHLTITGEISDMEREPLEALHQVVTNELNRRLIDERAADSEIDSLPF
jgi:hypothetical protein